MSKTKGGGSTRNGRDSHSKRLGVKVFDGTGRARPARSSCASGAPASTPARTWARGGDDTLFATADGTVKFGARKGRKLVDVLPA